MAKRKLKGLSTVAKTPTTRGATAANKAATNFLDSFKGKSAKDLTVSMSKSELNNKIKQAVRIQKGVTEGGLYTRLESIQARLHSAIRKYPAKERMQRASDDHNLVAVSGQKTKFYKGGKVPAAKKKK